MDLLILAAGMGSRFGGLKQMEPMDEYGNFIIDFSIYDAIEAGFDRVVFIIKDEIYDEFVNTIGKRVEKHIKVAYAFQRLSDIPKGYSLPEGREKPLGTGQAILAAKDIISNKFVMINADDFYGKDAFKVAANYLRSLPEDTKNVYANVTYKVANTLTENGTVKRGVCFYNEEKHLTKLVESSIGYVGNKIHCAPLDERIPEFDCDESYLVSMNMFVFSKDIMDLLEKGFPAFLDENKDNLMKCEYLIPDVVSDNIKNGNVVVNILSTTAKWFGVTYREDKQAVVDAIAKLTKDGQYKPGLWN